MIFLADLFWLDIVIICSTDSVIFYLWRNTPTYLPTIQEGPTYIGDICWKFKFWRNIIKLKESKYQTDIYNKCTAGKSDWICKSCHNSMMKNKTLMQAQLNNMELCPKFSELDRLCPVELMLNRTIFVYCCKNERCPAWT